METVFTDNVVGLFISVGICVVLPVAIVWIIFAASRNSDNKRAEVLIKAIENNSGIDADKLAEALNKKPKTPREMQLSRLLRGCLCSLVGLAIMLPGIFCKMEGEDEKGMYILSGICLAIGIAYLIVYFVGRKEYKE